MGNNSPLGEFHIIIYELYETLLKESYIHMSIVAEEVHVISQSKRWEGG